MKKRLWALLRDAAMISAFLCAISCFLLVLVFICGVVEALGLYHFGLLNDGDSWVMVTILSILLVFRLLQTAFNRLADWAGRKRDEIDERERREAKRRQEAEQQAREAKYRAWEAEYEAKQAAMPPEERERQRKKIQEEIRQEKLIPLLAIQRVAENKGPAAGASPDRSQLHDELDAVARAHEITKTYGLDWQGYDPEAPGPDPESSSGDIW